MYNLQRLNTLLNDYNTWSHERTRACLPLPCFSRPCAGGGVCGRGRVAGYARSENFHKKGDFDLCNILILENFS